MTLVAGSIARPVTVAMATFAVVLFGGISLDRLGLNLLPDLSYPTLTIRTDYEGAAPAEVEEQITRKIEQQVGVISGVRKMHSISAAGRSDVILEFAWGTDMDLAAIEVREKLDLVQLPLDVGQPTILRLNPNLDPIFRIALTRKRPLADRVTDLQSLRRFADDYLKRRLDPVPGVAAVIVSGGYEDQVSVLVDQQKLAQLGLTIGALGQRLKNTNINLSGGRLTNGSQEYLVRTMNQFRTIDDIRNTIIFEKAGRILRLKDVATVLQGQKERDAIMRVDGKEAIEIALYKEGDANTVEVAGQIRKALESLRRELPANYQLTTIYDQSTFIDAAIKDVQSAAIQGAFLAVLILYLFLRDVRSTLIVTATIPASVMATFALMRLDDITLNVMSLGGIALAVGMLMDNAIVVLENVARHRAEGADILVANEQGASEVAGAVTASTLTSIAVFLPLAFVTGIAGQLFRDQALTVTFALLASLVLAFTLIPMLSTIGARPKPAELVEARQARRSFAETLLAPVGRVLITGPAWVLVMWMRVWRTVVAAMTRISAPILNGFDRAYGGVALGYEKLLRLALQRRGTALILASLMFVAAVMLIPTLPLELIPPLSQGEFKVDFKLSPGTRLELTDRLLAQVQSKLLGDKSVSRTYSTAGTGGDLNATATTGGENVGELDVDMARGTGTVEEDAAMARVRGLLANIPDAQYTVEQPALFSFSTPLEMQVSGTNLDELRSVSVRLAALMEQSKQFRDIDNTMRSGYPEIQIRFDQDRIAAMGMTVPQVADVVVNKVKGNVPTEFTLRDKKIDIRIRVGEQQRNSVADIRDIIINPQAAHKIPLSSVADVSLGLGPSDIQRVNQQRVAIVSASVPGGDLGAAARKVNDMLAEIPMPGGVKVTIGGQNEEMHDSFRSLQFALVLAFIMVYLVMASLFESLLHPFIIMFTIPLAGVGAIFALALTRTSVSVVVFIGLILLVGIVVNNAIVLIDRVNGLRMAGMDNTAALMEGARQRLRPIMMTTLTTILGLLPMAIGFGDAGELRAPMAITVIGGLSISTLLTLVLIPVVYDLVDRKRMAGDVRAPGAVAEPGQ